MFFVSGACAPTVPAAPLVLDGASADDLAVVFAANDQSDAIATLLHSLAKLWPLWVLVALVAAVKLALWLHQELRLRRAGIAEVDRMNGPTFERFLVSLFRRLDYRVEHTGRRGDFGADLVVAKGGRRTVVQAKC